MYEQLRAQVFSGGHCRSGLAALLYHGMARGLALLAKTPTTHSHKQEAPARDLPAVVHDPTLVRLLANMVLQVQSEAQHVY